MRVKEVKMDAFTTWSGFPNDPSIIFFASLMIFIHEYYQIMFRRFRFAIIILNYQATATLRLLCYLNSNFRSIVLATSTQKSSRITVILSESDLSLDHRVQNNVFLMLHFLNRQLRKWPNWSIFDGIVRPTIMRRIES